MKKYIYTIAALSFALSRNTNPNHPNFGTFEIGGGSGKGDETAEEKLAKEISQKAVSAIAEKFPFLKDEKAKTLLADLAEMQTKLSKVTSAEDYETYKKENNKVLEDMGIKIAELSQKANPVDPTFKGQIGVWLTEKKDVLPTLYKSKGEFIELELKTVGDITTGSGSIIGTVPQYPIWGAPNFNLIGDFISQFVNVSATQMPAYFYTELVPKDGDYSFLNEGATKPEIDFKWETRIEKPTKVAAWVKLTEEVAQDVPRIQSIAGQYLLKKHNIKKQRGIISGNGVSPIPKGMTYIGRHFSAATIGATVVSPNIFDVINACSVDIATTHNYTDEIPYTVNLVMMHPIDYFRYIQSAKDDDKRPLYNYEALQVNSAVGQITNQWSGTPVSSGIKIIPTEEIPIGNILVCDASKFNSVNYIPYTVKFGWINDDFIKNEFVILAESRYYGYVQRLDQQAFIYDNIDTIMDAIEGTIS